MKFSEAEALLLPLIDGAEVQPWYLSAYAEVRAAAVSAVL